MANKFVEFSSHLRRLSDAKRVLRLSISGETIRQNTFVTVQDTKRHFGIEFKENWGMRFKKRETSVLKNLLLN